MLVIIAIVLDDCSASPLRGVFHSIPPKGPMSWPWRTGARCGVRPAVLSPA